MDCDLIEFKELIEGKTGIKVSDDEKLSAAITEMVIYNNIESEKVLLKLIGRDKKFLENLVGLLTINETYFFRESAQIKVFSNELIPLLVKHRKPSKINILSAGCSTGAEPYSLVIALMEKFGVHINHLFTVKGFDIDRKALSFAEKGIYGKYSFRGTDEAIIKKYFDKTGDEKYKIKSFVKEMVEFYPHNLLDDPSSDIRNEIDVIFYRNVAIYFSPENQKKSFLNLSSMLSDNGWLILSSTETLSHDYQILSLTNVNEIFLYQKDNQQKASDKKIVIKKVASKKKKPSSPKITTSIEKQPGIVKEPGNLTVESIIDKAQGCIRKKEYSDALSLIDSMTEESELPIEVYTMKASSLINLNRLDEAKNTCLKALSIDEFSLESFFLQGIIARLENNLAASEEKFKKMIYIDSSSWLANFYLAEIYRDRDEVDKSYKKYEVVIRQLEKNKPTEKDLIFGTFAFSEKELIHACKINMEKLKQRD